MHGCIHGLQLCGEAAGCREVRQLPGPGALRVPAQQTPVALGFGTCCSLCLACPSPHQSSALLFLAHCCHLLSEALLDFLLS